MQGKRFNCGTQQQTRRAHGQVFRQQGSAITQKQVKYDYLSQIFQFQRCEVRASAVSPLLSTDKVEKVDKDLKVLIAGGGIGGLVLAIGLLKKGIKVQVMERDMSSIRGEGKLRGPIQVQSNALAALEAIDADLARDIFDVGCITGDRINGLCDGVSGDWYVKFDTFHPAYRKGLPITRVISRMTLQEILTKHVLKYGGEEAIMNNAHVVGFREGVDRSSKERRVFAQLEDGSEVAGDVLIGADGIYSKVRKQLMGELPNVYSGYTCYTGISDYVPADIDTVGYRVFLGNKQYFVSSDVGNGKMQWYAFHKEDPGGSDKEGARKERLLEIFGEWNHMVVDLIKATPEDDVLRRDIYDRRPIFRWSYGRVALLGDSAHAMQPNLGQGGCMAIEDGFELAELINERFALAGKDRTEVDIPKLLEDYWGLRFFRASAIHGMARMAALMASTYRAYFGEGLGFLERFFKPLKIPHYGKVMGRFAMFATMPAVLDWVLGGNIGRLDRAIRPNMTRKDGRWLRTNVEEYPAIDEVKFEKFLINDDALLRSSNAVWLAVPEDKIDPDDIYFIKSGKTLSEKVLQIGDANNVDLYKEGQDYFLKREVRCTAEVRLNDERVLSNGVAVRVVPGDVVVVDGKRWLIKQRHYSVCPEYKEGGKQLQAA